MEHIELITRASALAIVARHDLDREHFDLACGIHAMYTRVTVYTFCLSVETIDYV